MLLTTVTMRLNGSRKLIPFVYLTFLILGLVSWQFLTLSTFPIFSPWENTTLFSISMKLLL